MKLEFLKEAAAAGYAVVLCFIGISGPDVSEHRVAMRLPQGGHDVPTDRLFSRFPRTLANLKAALNPLPSVLIFDNNDLRAPFRQVAIVENGRLQSDRDQIPDWLEPLLSGEP